MEHYPAIAFIVKHGDPLTLVIALLPPLVIGLLLHAAATSASARENASV